MLRVADPYTIGEGRAASARGPPRALRHVGEQVVSGKVSAGRSMPNHNAELSKLGKEVGEGLAHARGVSQADSRHPQPKHAKAHCDAVIAVGLDLRPAEGARIDPERVTDLLHVGTAFG